MLYACKDVRFMISEFVIGSRQREENILFLCVLLPHICRSAPPTPFFFNYTAKCVVNKFSDLILRTPYLALKTERVESWMTLLVEWRSPFSPIWQVTFVSRGKITEIAHPYHLFCHSKSKMSINDGSEIKRADDSHAMCFVRPPRCQSAACPHWTTSLHWLALHFADCESQFAKATTSDIQCNILRGSQLWAGCPRVI